jgi:hypothetical protein
MKICKTIADTLNYDQFVYRYFVMYYLGIIADTTTEDLLGNMGGYIHICDTQEEVNKVLAENTFDMWSHVEEGSFYSAVNINNNAGGPTFIIYDFFDVSAMKAEYDEFGDLKGIHG